MVSNFEKTGGSLTPKTFHENQVLTILSFTFKFFLHVKAEFLNSWLSNSLICITFWGSTTEVLRFLLDRFSWFFTQSNARMTLKNACNANNFVKILVSKYLTDTGEDSKLVRRRKRPKVDARKYLDVSACGKVSSPRLYRLNTWILKF